jgi:16S rRNA (cytosine967-C5)-methyltransferase
MGRSWENKPEISFVAKSLLPDMPISLARTAALDILLRVERENAYASELLHSSQYARLSSADHALATELVMGVLRWRSVLDRRIAAQSSQRLEKLDPEVLEALRLAAYQLGFLDRVPQRAAVHESVELVKRAHKSSAVPFTNAVLRKLAAATDETNASAVIGQAATSAELANASAHPLWMVERWERHFDFNTVRRICIQDQTIPPATVRLSSPDTEEELSKDGIELGAGQLLTSARRVFSGNLAKTRAFREGRVAIQDEASQLVALLVGAGKNVLDCCAAPGGKTRILAARNPNATILAAEVHPHRARLLRKLVPEKNVCVITADARHLPVNVSFDRVLADVPCSGTGTLARNPEIKWRLTPEDLEDFHVRQLAILQSALTHVAPGGKLIYSTCSLEPEENVAVVEEAMTGARAIRVLDCLLELQKLQQAGELAWEDLGSIVQGPFLRTTPGVHPCDGFFAAILQRD